MKHTLILLAMLLPCAQTPAAAPIDIGSRRELFVDDFLIQRHDGVELRLHSPTPKEVVLVYDAPWEGNGCTFRTVFRDGDRIRMWYTGCNFFSEDGTKLGGHQIYYCYAESRDGVHWTKPELGLYDFNGSKQNNIVWTAPGADNFMVFKDPNPASRPGEEYKAVASGNLNGVHGLRAWKSSDGLRWSALGDKLIISKGAFDTLNVAFWDSLRKQYFCYIRDFHLGIRDIRVATSQDFLTWTEPELLKYVDSPDEALYTNNVQPYYRAPHIFVGFPTRYVDRGWSPAFLSLPDLEHRQRRMKFESRFGTVITDGLFMSSRDGRTFNRWGEAFLRPGIERKHNWVYGDCYQNCGLIETVAEDPNAPRELSFYVQENHSKTAERTRRYTLRIDGFVSLSAPLKGGEMITKPLVFAGNQLAINFSTSAAGSIRVELQDADGKPIPGFALDDCHEVFGDHLDRVVTWKSGSELAKLAGKPIRLRFAMKDADLYSIQFR
jgi:hypothetical protein